MLFLCEKPSCNIYTQARVSFANFCISIVQLTATNFRDWFWDQAWNNKAAISCQSLNILDVRPEPFQFPSNFGSKWYSKYNLDGHLRSQPKLVLNWAWANETHFQISWAFLNTWSINCKIQLALEIFFWNMEESCCKCCRRYGKRKPCSNIQNFIQYSKLWLKNPIWFYKFAKKKLL